MGSLASSISGGGASGSGGGISGPEPASSTDNAIVRWDGTSGDTLQDSVVTISDVGVIVGATQANVDNIRLDGNTISTTDVNGNLVAAPNGTGTFIFPSGSPTKPGIAPAGAPDTGISWPGGGALSFLFDGTRRIYMHGSRISIERDDAIFTLGEALTWGLINVATAVARVGAGTSGLGALRRGQEVLARTADLTLTIAESGICYTNTGAAGQVIFTLPAAVLTNNVGATYRFVVRAAQNVRVVAAGTDIIVLNGAATAAGGRIDSATVGEMAEVFVAATGVWQAVDWVNTFVPT